MSINLWAMGFYIIFGQNWNIILQKENIKMNALTNV